ncbi:MAG: hypothetical protein WCG27_12305 [Pseudomonadota bacterium]
MAFKLGLIYFLSFILLSWIYHQGPEGMYGIGEVYPSFPLIEKKNQELRDHFKRKELANLLISYAIGGSKGVSKDCKTEHRALNLVHLFSPSGVHFTALMIWTLPFLWLLKRRSRKLHWLASVFLWVIPLFLPGYYAIKRICFLRIGHLLSSSLPFRPDQVTLFLIIFILDFLLGTYRYSPLSFVYSFLFLGILFALNAAPKLLLSFAFLGGQFIGSFFSLTTLTVAGFLWGQLLTALFTLFFPVLFFGYWLPMIFPYSWTEKTLALYEFLVSWAANFSLKTGEYYSSINLLLVTFLLFFPFFRYKLILLALLLLFHSNPCFNESRSKFLATASATRNLLEKTDN